MPDEGRVQSYSQPGNFVPVLCHGSSLQIAWLAHGFMMFHGLFEDSRTERITASEEPKKIDLSRAEFRLNR